MLFIRSNARIERRQLRHHPRHDSVSDLRCPGLLPFLVSLLRANPRDEHIVLEAASVLKNFALSSDAARSACASAGAAAAVMCAAAPSLFLDAQRAPFVFASRKHIPRNDLKPHATAHVFRMILTLFPSCTFLRAAPPSPLLYLASACYALWPSGCAEFQRANLQTVCAAD